MNKSESIKELAAALSIAQASFPHIPKDKTVKVKSDRGSYEFKYAPLESILSAIRPVLKDQGLAFIQSVSGDSLSTTILHKSGEWLQSDAIPVRSQSTKAQELGSAITYAKRYSLCAMLGIVADDDDDGNGADGNQVETKKPTPIKQGKGVISATTGAWESQDEDSQKRIQMLADCIRAELENKGPEAAKKLYDHETFEMEPEEETALWTRFSSTERSALKLKERKAA